eukprot:TRINITY_DN14123_c0_g1_i1.p1 TRINITY_DN14123_c0_g1~~TRINITY_DN14123_c0_g1_i1.p1  ORF type:complete len:1752 (+),score=457.52 TRINITY_DN14123_c0_g1_i1:72-5258(+)
MRGARRAALALLAPCLPRPAASSPTPSPTTATPSVSPTSSAPTPSPTASPTRSPTSGAPTSSPSWSLPTRDPTVSPTRFPSLSPTSTPPTVHPTHGPTVPPSTAHPTATPTANPSVPPSRGPTTQPPTQGPTAHPTREPSKGPTRAPSREPTAAPTRSPTTAPTQAPSSTPTVSPTRSPSLGPTVLVCPANQTALTRNGISRGTCVPCPPGTYRADTDPVYTCNHIVCGADQRVTAAHACGACPPGTTNAAGDDATGIETFCDPVLCPRNERVESNACVPCSGALARNKAGDDASGADTACDAIASILVQPAALTVSEQGGSATASVTLESPPYADVTIAVWSSDTGEGTVTPVLLLFAPSDWSTPRNITVTGAQDSIQDGDATFSIVFGRASSADADYDGYQPGSITATNTDDDVAGITVAPTAGLRTTEGGGRAYFAVTLHTQPRSPVAVALSTSNEKEGTAAPSPLHFSSGPGQTDPASWARPHTVTVTGVDDSVSDGDQPYRISLAVSSADAVYDGMNASDVSCVNVDNDVPGVRAVMLTAPVTTERGGAAVFTVALATQPAGDVTVALASSNELEGKPNPQFVAFTTANWNSARTVSVVGVDDQVSEGDVAYSVTVRSSSPADPAYDGKDWHTLQFVNGDNDTAGILVTPSTRQETSESAAVQVLAAFSIWLRSEPAAPVRLTLTSSDPSEGEVVGSAVVEFTRLNWRRSQAVTVRGRPDDVDDGDQEYAIRVSVASGDPRYNAVPVPDLLCVNRNVDVAGIAVVPNSTTTVLNVSEDGATASFTVRLTARPQSDVLISLAASDDREGKITPGQLVFVPSKWDVPLTVQVEGLPDQVHDEDALFYVVAQPSVSQDPKFHGIEPVSVAVRNRNIDRASITAAPSTGLVTTEQGGTATFVVRLGTKPLAAVRLNIFSNDSSEGAVSPASLSFDSGSWTLPQTVTVIGVQDAVQDGDVNYMVLLGAAVSADPRYNGLSAGGVNVTNRDDDVAGISVYPPQGGIVVSEPDGTATFTVVLDTQPAAPVTIAVASSDLTEATVSPSELVFTAAARSWATPQTVTVAAADDDVDDGDVPFTVNFGAAVSADPVYNGRRVGPLNAVCRDDDTAGIVLVPAKALSTTEAGSTATFTAVLSTQPTGPVRCAVTSRDTTEGILAPSKLSFTAENWRVPQTVTVSGVDDFVIDGDVRYSARVGPCTSPDQRYVQVGFAEVLIDNIDLNTLGAYLLVTLMLGTDSEALGDGVCAEVTAQLAAALSFPPTHVARCSTNKPRPGRGRGRELQSARAIVTLEIRTPQPRDSACGLLRDLAARVRAAPGRMELAGHQLIDSTATPVGCPKVTCASFGVNLCPSKELIGDASGRQCPSTVCDPATCCKPALSEIAVYSDAACGSPEWTARVGAATGFCQPVARSQPDGTALQEYGAMHCDEGAGVVYARVGFISMDVCAQQVGTVASLMSDPAVISFPCDCTGTVLERMCVPLAGGQSGRFAQCRGTRSPPAPTAAPSLPVVAAGDSDDGLADWHIALIVIAVALALLLLLGLWLCCRRGGGAAGAAEGGTAQGKAEPLLPPPAAGSPASKAVEEGPPFSPSAVLVTPSPRPAGAEQQQLALQTQQESGRREEAEQRLRVAHAALSHAVERAAVAERLHSEAVHQTPLGQPPPGPFHSSSRDPALAYGSPVLASPPLWNDPAPSAHSIRSGWGASAHASGRWGVGAQAPATLSPLQQQLID